jgi:hypothetical protein
MADMAQPALSAEHATLMRQWVMENKGKGDRTLVIPYTKH